VTKLRAEVEHLRAGIRSRAGGDERATAEGENGKRIVEGAELTAMIGVLGDRLSGNAPIIGAERGKLLARQADARERRGWRLRSCTGRSGGFADPDCGRTTGAYRDSGDTADQRTGEGRDLRHLQGTGRAAGAFQQTGRFGLTSRSESVYYNPTA
jgi:hypothetical protein